MAVARHDTAPATMSLRGEGCSQYLITVKAAASRADTIIASGMK